MKWRLKKEQCPHCGEELDEQDYELQHCSNCQWSRRQEMEEDRADRDEEYPPEETTQNEYPDREGDFDEIKITNRFG